MAFDKNKRRQTIKYRIRKKISGTNDRPRLSVFRSNKHIYAQIINDSDGKTLVAASSLNKEIVDKKEVTKAEQAKLVGKLLSEKALNSDIKSVVFDRNGYIYHGRVKALADAVREGGIIF